MTRPFWSSRGEFFVFGLFVIGPLQNPQQSFEHGGIALLGRVNGLLREIVTRHVFRVVRVHACGTLRQIDSLFAQLLSISIEPR